MTTMGVARMEHWTAGDYGGAFAGVVAALAALGKGLAWLLNWQGARDDRRSRRLGEWESSLNAREKEYREQLQAKFAAIEHSVDLLRTQNEALGVALSDVVDEVRRLEPASPVLARVHHLLRRAFPIEHDLPAAMLALLAKLDAREGGRGTGND